MSRIWAFDLDGVLAVSPPGSAKKWGHMKGQERQNRLLELLAHYARAGVLFRPTVGNFYVITARKNNEDVRSVTEGWLKLNFGRNFAGVYMLSESRSLDNVIAFKSRILKSLRVTDFAEDNPAVVKGLRKECPSVHVWLFQGGALNPDEKKVPLKTGR